MKPESVRIRQLVDVSPETNTVSSLYFIDELCSKARPGQYVMIWAPKVDEIPMSLSTIGRKGASSVTVHSVGEASKALCRLKVNDRIGLRGPFGNGFTISGNSPLIVAGGTGAVSLFTLAQEMIEMSIIPTFILGSKTRSELIFKERLEKILRENLILATDDGSCGFQGYASECAIQLIEKQSFDYIYTCGPELMMASIFEVTEKRGIPLQASLERYIKCAVGLCGSCAIGPYRVCVDGPIFESKQLRAVSNEFGKLRMDPAGRQIKVEH